MSVPTPTQQANTTLATFPAQFDDPANAKKIAKDRDGFPIGATKIRQARWEEFRQTDFNFNGAGVGQTLTPDSIIGGCVRLINAGGGGGIAVTLPTADDMSVALGAYAPLHPNPAATPAPAVLPGVNTPGTWKRQIRFTIENASTETATITANTRMTIDAASTTVTIASGASHNYAICSNVSTPGSISYVIKRI